MKYIIGDIHANIAELKKFLKVINMRENDELIFLGDYLGKNIYTKETMNLLELLIDKYQCTFIRGNHEFVWDRYVNFKEFNRQDFLLRYGDLEALRQFVNAPEELIKENKIELIKEYLRPYFNLLPKMIDYLILEKYVAMHAGITKEQINENPLEFKEINYFLRPNNMDGESKYLGKYIIVAGHTFLGTEPLIKNGYINIDLGAGHGGFLGGLCVEKDVFFRSDGATFKV